MTAPTARSGEAAAARVVLLDALGTLVELEPPAPHLREQLAQRLGLQVSDAAAERAIAAEIAYYRAHLGDGTDQASLEDLRQRCAKVLARELGRDLGQPVPADERMTEALLASLRFARFADVLPALRGLRRQGLGMVVVSNWDVSLHSVLERAGVAPCVDAVLTSAEVGVRKPAAAIFDRALALAGVAAAGARHVGDSIEEDVSGALGAGIKPILLRRDGGPGPPGVATISSLLELPEMLAPGAE